MSRVGRLSWLGVLRSEWVKLRSLPSLVVTLLLTVVVVVALGSLVCWAQAARWDEESAAERLLFDPVRASLAGVFLAQLATGVVGVLVSAGEFATGLSRSTFAAVPRRLLVLSAKVVVVSGTVLALCVPAALTAFVLGQELLSGVGAGTSFRAPGVLRAVLGAGVYLTGVALLGLALGFLLRSVAGAVSALVGLLLVVPLVVVLLPSSWSEVLLPVLPSSAGQAMLVVRDSPFVPSLGPGGGALLFGGYLLVVLLAAAWRLVRRDV